MAKLLLFIFIAAAFGAEPPRNIISTAPNITEILFALGLEKNIAGVTTYCHYPPAALAKPKIGGYMNPSVEQIVALRPNLVIVPLNTAALAGKLTAFHIPVLGIRDGSIAEIYETIGRIGAATGRSSQAAALAATMRRRLDAIQQRTAAKPKLTTLFVVGRDPGTLGGLFAAGRGSFLHELIGIAGGQNILADSRASFPGASIEEIVARDPEVIIDMSNMANTGKSPQEAERALYRIWSQFPKLQAVRHHRLYTENRDIFVVPGPRIVDAAEAIEAILHPRNMP